ncbi:MAG: replication factor C small subunit [Candidatus Altiarchaeota archaeon]|nr:replication factor C small subunit [Candidatus Altiarchaeota archaeon]
MDFNRIWTEKYRPETLSQMINQKHIISRLQVFVDKKSIPHMLFAGPPGVGKTTAALALTKEFFGEFWKDNYLELNASDERGIDVVRVKVKDFARTQPLGGSFKIIFLDEADALTKDAQQALRRTMEKFSNTCRFILSCNYPSKIIEPIQSRTVVFRFRGFVDEDIYLMLKQIAKNEGLSPSDEGLHALTELSNGDARSAINLLQSVSSTDRSFGKDDVYETASHAKPKEIKEMINLALDGKFSDSRKLMLGLLVNRGLSGDLILKEIHSYIVNSGINDKIKAELINIIGEFEFRILEGATELIQLDALLAKLASLGVK